MNLADTRHLFDYTEWANGLALEAAAKLSDENLHRDFQCGVSLAGCWCSEIDLSDEARAEMRARYRGCLCLQCLERLSEPPAVAGGLTSDLDSCAIAEDQPPATAGGSDVDNPR